MTTNSNLQRSLIIPFETTSNYKKQQNSSSEKLQATYSQFSKPKNKTDNNFIIVGNKKNPNQSYISSLGFVVQKLPHSTQSQKHSILMDWTPYTENTQAEINIKSTYNNSNPISFRNLQSAIIYCQSLGVGFLCKFKKNLKIINKKSYSDIFLG